MDKPIYGNKQNVYVTCDTSPCRIIRNTLDENETTGSLKTVLSRHRSDLNSSE